MGNMCYTVCVNLEIFSQTDVYAQFPARAEPTSNVYAVYCCRP